MMTVRLKTLNWAEKDKQKPHATQKKEKRTRKKKTYFRQNVLSFFSLTLFSQGDSTRFWLYTF